MTVTKILGEQSGIQYQGVVDKSEADPRDNLINALFTGEFKNGPFNKPFKVTQANIRAKLGFDPDSLYYQAIQDALNTGVPFVWVMRSNSKPAISCAGATEIFIFSRFNGEDYDLEVDSVLYENTEGDYLGNFIQNLAEDENFPLSENHDGFLQIENMLLTKEVRVRIIPNSLAREEYEIDLEQSNTAFFEDSATGIISFCLSKAREAE